MKKAVSILLTVLLLIGSIPLSVFYVAATDPSENLAADYSNANGAVTWTENAGAWGGTNIDGSDGVLGGRSWKFGLDGTATDGSSFAYITVKASGLKANTYYEFSYVYSQDFKILLDSVTAPDGGAAALVSSTVDTELSTGTSAHQISFIFEAAADGDYEIKLKTGKAWQTPTCTWSYTMLSDLNLIEKTDFVPNLAADYSNANGAVTWTENADAWGGTNIDGSDGVLGGRSWKFGVSQTSSTNIAYITVKASGLKANTYYEFSYVYSQDFKILFDSVTAPDGSAAALASSTVDTELSTGTRAHQISFIFEAAADGDYEIKLKTGKAWTNEPCGWSYTMLSDLRLIKKTDFVPNLAADYSNANGAVTWTENAEAWGGTNIDGSDGVLGGRSWKFGVSQTSSTNIAYITVKASGLKANTYYEFSYVYSQDFKILFDSVTAPDGSAAALVSNTVDTELTTGTRAHQISFIFEAAADGDYEVKLKTGKAWTNEPCGWSYTMLSDLSLIKKTDFVPDLAANYTHANGAVTWTESAGAWGDHVDGSDGVLGGRSWKFGLDGTATDGSSFAYITVKASGLKANTYYEFSYVYSQDFKILLDSVTAPDGSAAALVSSSVDTELSTGTSAHQISFIFEAAADGDYEIKLKTGKAWQTPTCGWSYTMLSDLSLTEKTYPLPEEITGFTGTAMRTQGKQALRYKFSISKDLVNNGVDGYEVVEYGSVAIRTDYLNGKALVKGGEYTVSDTVKKAVSGAAYNKDAGTQIIFDETENDYFYTAALVNIGYNKATAETDYAVWGYDYSVRSYIVLRDTATGALATIYDATTAQASVFAVMYEILTSTSSDAQDHIAMQAILDSNTAIADAYAAWKTAKGYSD